MDWKNESDPFENNGFFDELTEYMQSPQGQLEDTVRNVIANELDNAGLDPQRRCILWEDGKALSLADSARRIHEDNEELPLHEIEMGLLS